MALKMHHMFRYYDVGQQKTSWRLIMTSVKILRKSFELARTFDSCDNYCRKYLFIMLNDSDFKYLYMSWLRQHKK